MQHVNKITAGWGTQTPTQQSVNPCSVAPWTCGGTIYGPSGSGTINSSVPIVFGRPGEGGNTIGYATGGSGGIGVVVDNMNTIVTAEHVYLFNLESNSHNTLWVQVSGRWVTYALADLKIAHGPGDIVTITLPSKLPGYVLPAQIADSYDSKAGQSVVTTYSERIYQGNKLAAFTLHSMTTTIYDPPSISRTGGYGWQLAISNTSYVLNSGDSGGGVFYNGQLIGVNSQSSDAPVVTVAPLCWTWYGRPC